MADFERSIFGPPADDAILPYYEGKYDRAFIALHPFFSIAGVDPATAEHGTLILFPQNKPDDLGLLEWGDVERAQRMVGKKFSASELDEMTKSRASPVRWGTVCAEAGFADYRDLNRALRTSIGGLRVEFADEGGADRLVSYAKNIGLFLPTEGMIQPTMEAPLVELLQRVGLTDIWMGDEFGDKEDAVPVAALDMVSSWRSSDTLAVPFPRRLFAEDRSLLVVVPWDDFFTIILGTNRRLANFDIANLFEGFWASSETSIGLL